jgi:molecular chaperone GrpE
MMTHETETSTDQMEPFEPEQPAEAGPVSDAEALASAKAELAATKDQLLRALADAENARKRAERQVSEARAYAIDRFARDILPTADNLSRAIAAISAELRADLSAEAVALLEGVELTEKTLLSSFERHGLKPIAEAGRPFDPNVHEAVAQIPAPQPAGHVAQVFQPGWRLADRTLRPAMVAVSLGPVVAQAPTSPSTNAPEPSDDAPPPGSFVDRQA